MLESAAQQYDTKSRLITVGKASARRAWATRRIDLLPVTVATLMARAALEAELAMESVLAEQDMTAPAVALLVPQSFGTQTSDGRSLAGLFEQAASSATLELMTATQIADTWRGSTAAAMAVRPDVTGWVRNVGAKCCSRCAVLSGKFYRWREPMLRHPGCRCENVVTTRSRAGEVSETPRDLFDQGRITDLSKANAKAIELGADVSQVANAYRTSAGMRFAQSPAIKRDQFGRKFTTEGTTVYANAYKQQAGIRGVTPGIRLMPETILARAQNHEEAIRNLRAYGWIKDDAAAAQGRALIAERARIRRNARGRARRAAASAEAP